MPFSTNATAFAVALSAFLPFAALLLAPVSNTEKTPNPTTKPKAALPPSGEVRAMWIVRDSMVSPQKIKNAVALAKKHGFNTIFVQVRGRGDAFYHSNFEPRSEELVGQPEDFDPLAVAVSEGHKAGLEVHAWMNTFLVWHKGRLPYSSLHVVYQHPEWIVRDKNGGFPMSPRKDCEGAFLDPAIPAVRDYTKKVFLDVASRYDVDGLHFDYVRFPSGDYSFAPADLDTFREWLIPRLNQNDIDYADKKAASNRLAWYYCFPEHWRDWRESVVTETVKQISSEAHRLKPHLIVSAAVFPNYQVASRDKGQAWHDWLQTGVLDAACPMTYNSSTKLVGAQIRDAVAHSAGRPIVAGVGAWQMPANSAIAKAQVYRELGAAGINFFSYDGMTHEGRTESYLSRVSETLFAISPTMPPDWKRLPVLTETEPPMLENNRSSVKIAQAVKVLQDAVNEGAMPGTAFCVYHKGGRILDDALGTLDGNRPTRTDSIYDLASLTKPMATGASVLTLVEQGRLLLGLSITDFLGEPAAHLSNITIKHLLTHTSGLPAWTACYINGLGADAAVQAILQVPPTAAPEIKYEYSCLNFILLGRIVEIVSGQSLNAFAQTNVFTPLGLTDTGYLPAGEKHERIAPTIAREGPDKDIALTGIVHDGNARGIGGVSGNAGLFGTARDVAAFGENLRVGGPNALFGAPTLARALSNQVNPSIGAHSFLFFAQGNGLCPSGDLLSPLTVGHSGYTGTVLTLDPAYDLTVAVLTNSVFGEGKSSWLKARRHFLNALAAAL